MPDYDINRDSEGRITSVRESAPYKSDDHDPPDEPNRGLCSDNPTEVMWSICAILFVVLVALVVIYLLILVVGCSNAIPNTEASGITTESGGVEAEGFSVVTATGEQVAVLWPGLANAGQLSMFDPTGVRVDLGVSPSVASPTAISEGALTSGLTLWDPNGVGRVQLTVDDGDGMVGLALRDEEWKKRASLFLEADGNPLLILWSATGSLGATLSNTQIAFWDTSGNPRLILGLLPDGTPAIGLFNAAGQPVNGMLGE